MDDRTIKQVRDNETKLINEIKELETQLKKQKEIIDKLKRTLIYSKECKLATAMELNSKQSILIELLQILEDKEV